MNASQRQTWRRKQRAFPPTLAGVPVLANANRFFIASCRRSETIRGGTRWRVVRARSIEASTAWALEARQRASAGSTLDSKPDGRYVARTAPSSPGHIPHRRLERAVAPRALLRLRPVDATGASMRGNSGSAPAPQSLVRDRTPARPPKREILARSPCKQAFCRRLTFPHSFARATRTGTTLRAGSDLSRTERPSREANYRMPTGQSWRMERGKPGFWFHSIGRNCGIRN